MKGLKLMIALLKEKKFIYLAGIILNALASPLINIVAAVLMMDIFDKAVYDITLILPIIGKFLLLTIILSIIIPLSNYLINYGALQTTGSLRMKTLKKLIDLDQSTLKGSHTGDLISRVTTDIQTAEQAYKEELVRVTEVLFNGIGCTVFMFYLNWPFALGIISYQLLTLFLVTRFAKHFKKVSEEMQKSLGGLTERISDILAGSHVIKFFNLGDYIIDLFRKQNNSVLAIGERRAKINGLYQGVNTFVWMGSFIGVIAVASIFMALGYIQLGVIIALVQLQNGVTQLFNSFGRFVNQLQKSLAGFERIVELLENKEEPKKYLLPEDNGDSEDIIDEEVILQFKGVSFQYDEETKVINNLNFAIRKGETVAIVGPSGGGKSTLFKLILGFHFPQKGQIYIKGKKANLFTIEEVRELFSYVPQEPYLFSGTVSENISYGRDNATREEIIEGAKKAFAHEFIQKLEKGYDTLVGERGCFLSGGQKQRIAIARAIIKNAEILLLDEATSALDNESEALVQQALEKLMENKTAIVIAHRLSTIKNADRILVMDGGTIVEEGSHEELLEKEGIYAKMFKIQFGELAKSLNSCHPDKI